jgi:hypothetical protein
MSVTKAVAASAGAGDLIAALGQPVTSGAPSSTAAAPPGGATNLIAALSEPLATSSVQAKARHVARRIQSDAWQLAHEMYTAPFPQKPMDDDLEDEDAWGLTSFSPPDVSETLSSEALESHRFGYRARQYIFIAYQLADGTLGNLLVENPTAERIELAIDRFLESVSESAEHSKSSSGPTGQYATTLSEMKSDKEKVATLYKQAVRNIFLPQVANEAMEGHLLPPLKAIVIGYCQVPSIPFIYEALLVDSQMDKRAVCRELARRGVLQERAEAVTAFAGEYMYLQFLMKVHLPFTWDENLKLIMGSGGREGPKHAMEAEGIAEASTPFAISNAPLTAQAFNASAGGIALGVVAEAIEPCSCFYCSNPTGPLSCNGQY